MDASKDDQSQYFRDLYQLASSDLDPSEKIAEAIAVGRERLGLAYGVLSYTGEGKYEIVETNITTGKFQTGSITPLEDTWCRHVVETNQLIAFANVEQSAYRDDIAKETTGLQCYIGTPITIDGETYGTLCYSDENPRDTEITEDEKHFIQLLADWISHELERTKHHRELREQNERLDEFTGIVAHDLRNPLSGAIGFTELALEQTDGEVHDYLQRVAESLDRMDAMIGECLVLAKEGTDIGQRQEVNITKTARNAWETVRTKDASLTIETNKTILADEERLQRVFENVFRNAVEHCQAGVEITVSDRSNGFAISDNGPGLPEEVVDALVDSDVENIKQLGLGLLIVDRIISGHDWELSVEASSEGTTFEITDVNTAAPAHREEAPA
ncbi:MAG: GAF domain-containing sensor histidine kinase [Halobacteriales archaeon]